MRETGFNGLSLSAFDWAAVASYLVATAGLVLWTRLRQRGTSEDYFLAGRSQGWLIVAVTLFASLFSSISFVAVPGEAYRSGLVMSTILIASPLCAPLAVWLFLRFFFLSPSYTAYEYLERRFNVPARVIGAMLFCLTRLIYSGVIYYAAAELFRSLVGWAPLVTILAIGTFTVVYTTVGGMKALIATDVMQVVVLIVGIASVLLKVLAATGFDLSAIYHHAAINGRGYELVATAQFYHFNLHDRLNVWLLIWMVTTTTLMSLSADQMFVQRLLTSKDYASAKRSVYVKFVASVPIVLMFWVVGIGLRYYYDQFPARLPAGIAADHVMGHFIGTELPAPLPGLIVAAMLAALMSTTSSVVSSIATVAYRDGLVRMGLIRGAAAVPGREILICKALSVLAGIAGIGVALLLIAGGQGMQSSVFEINAVWGGLIAILMSAFLLGVLTTYVSGPAMVIGLTAGAIVGLVLPYVLYYNVPPADRISFYWVGAPSVLTALLIPLPLSFIWRNRKDMTGLTLRTLQPVDRERIDALAPAVPATSAT